MGHNFSLVVTQVPQLVTRAPEIVTRVPIVTRARFQGTRVVDRRWGETTRCSLSKSDKAEKVTEITTKSCRLLHGSYSWLANGLKLGIGDSIAHWWMIIETSTKYYMVQFRGGVQPYGLIEMRKCGSWSDCIECGLAEAGKGYNDSTWTESSYSYKWSNESSKSIGDVVNYLDNYNANYSLLSNNCQGLCRNLYHWF